MEEIEGALNEILAGLGLKRGIESAKALTDWEQIVGEKIAAHAQAFSVKKDILFVTTSSPMWTQELSLMKRHLVKRINAHLKQDQIREIRFLTRGVNAKSKHAPDEDSVDLKRVALSAVEMSEVDHIVEEIDDQELRESMRRVLIYDKKLKRWQREHKSHISSNTKDQI